MKAREEEAKKKAEEKEVRQKKRITSGQLRRKKLQK